MKRHSLAYGSVIYFVIICMMASASCSVKFTARSTPTAAHTSTPEPLKLINGVIDACLLVTPTELETVTGFNTVGDSHPINPSGTSCIYSKTDGKRVLRILVTTDATLKRNHRNDTAEELYNFWKAEELKDPNQYTVEDIDGLGSPAYFSNDQGWELTVRVLNNRIYYEFTGYSTIGVNRDKLIQIAKIALQRVP